MELFDDKSISQIKKLFSTCKQVSIIGHKDTDADSLGASLALNFFLEKFNIKTRVFCPNAIPNSLRWLDPDGKIMIYEAMPTVAAEYLKHSDIILMVDFSQFGRIGNMDEVVKLSDAVRINIDHHKEPEFIGNYNFINSSASSASELVYNFIKKINIKNIDKQIAEYLYAGIISDTHNFSYNAADQNTLLAGAELLGYGVCKSFIINNLYNKNSLNRMRLLGYLLSNEMIYLSDYKFIILPLSKEVQKKFDYKQGDHENFVNYPLSIENVNFSAFLLERSDYVRLSLRSIGDLDVSNISKKFFDGGGHKNAAGGMSYLNISDTIQFFLKNIDKIINAGTTRT